MPNNSPCPCGAGRALSACCGPFVDGWSHAPRTRGSVDRGELSAWAKNTEFTRLQVVLTDKGGASDQTGVVAFVARMRTGGRVYSMFERSRFERHEGRWVYLDGEQEAAG